MREWILLILSINNEQQQGCCIFLISSHSMPLQTQLQSQLILIMPQRKLILANLTTEMVPQCTQIFSRSFIRQNTLWQKLGISQKQAEDDLELKFKYAAGTPTSFVMIDPETQQIGAITITIDIIDYIRYLQETYKKQNEGSQRKGIQILSNYGLQVEKAIFESIGNSYERKQFLYNFGAATDPAFTKYKVSAEFWFLVTDYYKRNGYKAIFCRASTRQTTKMMQKLGGRVISQLGFKQSFLDNEKFQVIRLDFEDPRPKL